MKLQHWSRKYLNIIGDRLKMKVYNLGHAPMFEIWVIQPCLTTCYDTWQLIVVMTRGNVHLKQITSQFSQHGRTMAIEYVDST